MDPYETDDFLEHYGIKGMKWGVRRDDYTGASRRTNREAAKDAREYARAKMFYGEGAGNRRKLINAAVQAKSNKDETYKAAFDHHIARQDMSTHADKARGERKRKDVKNTVGKTARGVNRVINGPFAAPLGAVAVAGAIAYAKANNLDQKAMRAGVEFIRRMR